MVGSQATHQEHYLFALGLVVNIHHQQQSSARGGGTNRYSPQAAEQCLWWGEKIYIDHKQQSSACGEVYLLGFTKRPQAKKHNS